MSSQELLEKFLKEQRIGIMPGTAATQELDEDVHGIPGLKRNFLSGQDLLIAYENWLEQNKPK